MGVNSGHSSSLSPGERRGLYWEMKTPLLLLLPLLLCACGSGTKDIATATERTRTSAAAISTKAAEGAPTSKDIRSNAEATEGDLRTAKDTGDVGPLALPHVESALSHQKAIVLYTVDLDKTLASITSDTHQITTQQSTIVQALPSVTDKEAQWLTALKKLAWIVAPLALIILLWQTGLGTLIKQAVWSFGLFLPRATNISAKFDAETLETGAPTPSPREAVAARRASDPAYDAAYRLHQRKIRSSSTPPPTSST